MRNRIFHKARTIGMLDWTRSQTLFKRSSVVHRL